jgi:esterase/lipase superfamily enzyme
MANGHSESPATASPAPAPPRFTRVEVAFSTNRAATDPSPPDLAFGGARGSLVFGRAIVTVPYRHRPGDIELPAWYNPFPANPTRHFTIEREQLVPVADWQAGLRAATQRGGRDAVLLFVHGYRNSFDDALYRTAQIAYDVRFRGAVAMFSWPSVNRVTGYPIDDNNADWSVPDFKAALGRILQATGSSEIYIIAHSMGNQVVTQGLIELARTDPTLKTRVRELILAAPDIDAAIFRRDIAPFLAGASGRTTLYASSRDLALTASRSYQGYVRAGDTNGGVVVVPPVETIDASGANEDLLGHSYVASSPSILRDVDMIINQRLPPAQRGLAARRHPNGAYWVYAPR